MKLSLVTTLLTIPFLAFSQSWDLDKIAARPKRVAGERFGQQVEVNGLNAFVTSPFDTDDESENPGGTKGSIYIYAKASVDEQWSLTQKIKSPNSNLAFGTSLAAEGDYLVVGATSSATGAAYVYKKNGEEKWELIQTLTGSNPTNDDRFGDKVGISGNTILVTAYGRAASASLPYCGAAYVYEKDANDTWVEKQMLTASDPAANDILGFSCALNGDIIILGAPGEGIDDASGSANRGHGAVYVYRKQSGTWVQTDKMVQEVRVPFASFGLAIAMSENNVIVAAQTKTIGGKITASFYELSETPKFDVELLTDFTTGFNVVADMSGRLAAMSLVADGVLKVYSFEKDTQTSHWNLAPTIYSPNFDKDYSRKLEMFGASISLSGNDILIGAPANDADGGSDVVTDSGVVYFFRSTGKQVAFTKTFYPELEGYFYDPILVDFDNDGDLDLFGNHNLDQAPAQLYRKDPTGFTKVRDFPAASVSGTTVWLDADRDGWLDLFSRHSVEFAFTHFENTLYINKHDGTFKEQDITFPGNDGDYGYLHFADYDVDGDLDVLMQVDPYYSPYMKLFRNEGDFTFTDPKISFSTYGYAQTSQPWFDFNNDGFPDFVTIGNSCSNTVALHINNEGKSFTSNYSPASAMDGTEYGNPAWGNMIPADYDNDGDDDWIWTGNRSCESSLMYTGVIDNKDKALEDSQIKFRGFTGWASIVIADFNNDGISDLVTNGQRTEIPKGLELLLGTGNGFEKFQLYETPTGSDPQQGMDLGDIDNDGDLDLFIYASTSSLGDTKPMIYINNAAQGWTNKNEAPSTPAKPGVEYGEDYISIKWMSSTDDTTPSAALTYNVLLTRGDSIILNTYSRADGTRQRYVAGNAGHRTFLYVRNLKDGRYKARVQAIDNSFAGSSFSEVLEFVIGGEQPGGDDPGEEDPGEEVPGEDPNEEGPVEITGLEDTFQGLRIYPVPSQNELYIENKDGDQLFLSIIDASGREHSSIAVSDKHERLNLSNLAPGVYSIRIVKDGNVMMKRFVKM